MNPTPLSHKVAIITGGASGIGEATVRRLAREGATVFALDRDAQALRRVAKSVEDNGGVARILPTDLADSTQIGAAVDEVLQQEGRIDILVNCAGIVGPQGNILEISEDAWDEVHAVNAKAPFLLIQHVGRHMVERGGGGRIVNVTSSSAFRARMAIASYASAKSALTQLTRTAAADLGHADINVNAVAPGLTASPMTRAMGSDEEIDSVTLAGPLENLLGRASRPDDIAGTILFLCLPESRQITGQTIHVSAGAVI